MATIQLKHRMCGASEAHQRLCEEHPECRITRSEIYNQTAEMIRNGRAFSRTAEGIIRIPVVVHVVYNDKSENISSSQIKSQIKVLNRDYRAKNTDKIKVPDPWKGLIADIKIEFYLAVKDPDGRITKGITRTKTSRSSFSTDDSVKSSVTGGADPWPSDKYLNLWACTLGDGLLGYAQFPGMPPETDGVVILNSAFGTTGTVTEPFNKGRTATHEIGHWLNLNHIWGDANNCTGTDHVEDTPNAQLPNYGKPSFPHISCHNGPSGDMFMNYMDYVDDDSMVMFTVGQSARMHSTLVGPRASIGT
jgi:hypothetical protein